MKCKVKDCQRKVAHEEDPKYRCKIFCIEHRNYIKVKCMVCGKELNCRSDRYRIKEDFICHPCFMNKHNRSEKMIEHSRQLGLKTGTINITKYNKSEQGRKKSAEIGKKYGMPALKEKWIGTPEHIKQATELGKRIGPITWKNNFINWIKSKENKEHCKEVLSNFRNSKKGKEHLTSFGARMADNSNRINGLKNFFNSMTKEQLYEYYSKTIFKNFDREKFYSEIFDVISFKSSENKISLEQVDSLKGVPGVWAIKDSNGIVYDVAQTNDIGSEMLKYSRRLQCNKGLSDEQINNLKKNKYNRKKFRNIMNDVDNPIFYIIVENVENIIKREAIEAQYAYNTKAKYWSPAPGQNLYKD